MSDDLDLARALANPERTLRVLARAIAATAESTDLEREGVRALARAIYARDLELDAPVLVDLIVVLVGLLATKLDKTPRAIWEQLWRDAPTDAWWSAHVNVRREEGT